MQLEEMETFEYIDVYIWRSNQLTLSCSDGPASKFKLATHFLQDTFALFVKPAPSILS